MRSGSGSSGGFDYYLERLQQEREETRSETPLKLLRLLARAEGERMDISALASVSGMEVAAFVDAIQKMVEGDLVTLSRSAGPEGETTDKEEGEILVGLTPTGSKVVSSVLTVSQQTA